MLFTTDREHCVVTGYVNAGYKDYTCIQQCNFNHRQTLSYAIYGLSCVVLLFFKDQFEKIRLWKKTVAQYEIPTHKGFRYECRS